MATYKKEKGFAVQTLASDTAASGISAASWASGGSMNRGNNIEAQGAGASNTAAIAAGGQTGGPPYAATGKTEKYNGTAWTEVNDLNSARNNSAASSNSPDSSMLYFGGTPPGTGVTNTESWNGSNWTEVNDLNLARGSAAGAGTSNTSALCFTGESPEGGASGPHTDSTEAWDGSSWTEVNDLNTGRREAGGTGTKTAALCIGGSEDPPAHINKVEQWDGTSWTEIAEINTARNENASAGIVTSALTFGGRTPSKTANTEHYDGTSWTEVNDLSTARSDSYAGGGTATSTLLAGGETSTAYTNVTEEFTAPTDFTKQNLGQVYYNSTSNAFKVTQQAIPAGTWSAGGNMVEGRYGNSGFGTTTSAVTAGGQPPAFSGTSSKTEQYDGSAWSEVNDLNTDHFFAGALGSSYTAGIVMGGQTPPGARIAITESWNGTNWTEVNDLNTARSSATLSATGTSTAGIYAGGRTSPGSPGGVQSVNESWDGTSWTEVNDLNTARYGAGSGGIQTSALQFGGYNGTAVVDLVETWDGTSWTETTELNTQRTSLGGTGSSNTSALAYGGLNPPGRQNETEIWNGTSWTEINNMSTARQDFGNSSALSVMAAIAAGGETGPAVSAATEEWTVPTGNRTITVS